MLLLCCVSMRASDGHRKLTVGGEPFCGFLGTTLRQKNPFHPVFVKCVASLIHLQIHHVCGSKLMNFKYIYSAVGGTWCSG